MSREVNVTPEIAAFHREVHEDALEPLWMAAPSVMLREPKSKPIPYIWKRESHRKSHAKSG